MNRSDSLVGGIAKVREALLNDAVEGGRQGRYPEGSVRAQVVVLSTSTLQCFPLL